MRRRRRWAWPNWRQPGDHSANAQNRAVLIFRWIVLLLLVAAALNFAMFIGTGQLRYRLWGIRIVKWTVIAALVFFAVLILERMAMVL
jgi:hypothetical protein